MDFTSTGIVVPHTNPEKEDLPASPVLLVATVDGLLRFYTLSHAEKASARLVQPPRPVPAIAAELLPAGMIALPHSRSVCRHSQPQFHHIPFTWTILEF